MKQNILLIAGLFFLSLGACKKSDSTTTTPTSPTSPTSPSADSTYYFKFSLGSTAYDIYGYNPQYMTFSTGEVGGYQDPVGVLFPSMGLAFDWSSIDTISESNVLSLAGKTFYFNDTSSIKPNLYFNSSLIADEWTSDEPADTSYYVHVSNVVYLKNDTTLGTPLRTYVITGTCRVPMVQDTTHAILSGGTFNMIISKRIH